MSNNIPQGTTKLLEKLVGRGAIKDQRLRFLLYTMTLVMLVALPISIFALPENLRFVVFVICVFVVCFLASIIIIVDKRSPTTQSTKKQHLPQNKPRESSDDFAAEVKIMGTRRANIAHTGPGGRVEVTDSEDIDIQDTGHKQ